MQFEIGCTNCGGDLTILASGVPADRRTSCTVVCDTCEEQLLVRVELALVRPGKVRHG